MYRITKVLNHNTVLAVKDKSAREYLIVGKGVGFGKKITQSVEPTEEDSLYELTQTRDRGPAKDIVKSIEPEYLEIANTLLDNAEHEFGHRQKHIVSYGRSYSICCKAYGKQRTDQQSFKR